MDNKHIGNDNFRVFLPGNDAYVDKSLFIQQSKEDTILITRPRR
ncbi:hypothetical protein MHYMCMPSP_00394 [Hyalomma marginatum]|uniref:Uncharacterized protein n=1 Tax=Hyalomma marginatum TaxID=34627 RepID=A0A8S4C4H2_9ACAR|nr:hypothetical protein MHYMCMPASI_00182 [Hyalomma marginatum]CAG7590985.1 hypothetical protein MHYMCMPSP_00394 [Hyalomma marginatum]